MTDSLTPRYCARTDAGRIREINEDYVFASPLAGDAGAPTRHLLIVADGVFAPWVAPYDPLRVDMSQSLLEPGPGHVRLKVDQVGVCGTDLHIHEGDFGAVFPLVPGHELVGVHVRAVERRHPSAYALDGFH